MHFNKVTDNNKATFISKLYKNGFGSAKKYFLKNDFFAT